MTGDVQKKITRWVSGAGVLDELFPESPSSQDEGAGKQPSGLVLVASLLNKIPNLGGELLSSNSIWHTLIVNTRRCYRADTQT